MRVTRNSTLGRRKFNLATSSNTKSRSKSVLKKPTSKAPVPVHHHCCTADDGVRRWEFVRRNAEGIEARKAYEDFGPPNFLVHVMYGGSFVEGDEEGFQNMKYVGGVCSTLYNFNMNMFYLSELDGFGAALMKTREMNMFYIGYHKPYQCDSWKLLKDKSRLEELFCRVDGVTNCVWVYLATFDFMAWVDSEELLAEIEDEERDNYDGESSGTVKDKNQVNKPTPPSSAIPPSSGTGDAGQVKKGVKRDLQLPPLPPQANGKGKIDGQFQGRKKMMKTSWPMNVTPTSSATPLETVKSKLTPRRSARATVKLGASVCQSQPVQTVETMPEAAMSQPLPRRSPRKLSKGNLEKNKKKDVSKRFTQ